MGTMALFFFFCFFLCVCDADEEGCVGGGIRIKGGEKWKAPLIKSVKECERGAHGSKQTLSRDSSLFFIYALPRHHCPPPLLQLFLNTPPPPSIPALPPSGL